MIRKIIVLCVIILTLSQMTHAQLFESLFTPEKYVVFQCQTPPQIDGIINEPQWESAPWTESFCNIEGKPATKPKYDTKVKMLWDNKYFYIAARLYDKHIWATIKQKESMIFDDNDFEVFIDPNGDTHDYMQLEINAFNTICDLLMDKPFRDGGTANVDWNFTGLKTAVKVYGKINRTSGKDSCWTVEIAIPWKSMIEFSDTKKIPVDGEQWRINFLRVQWNTNVKDNQYKKDKGPNFKPLPPMNWVWSPQGSDNMHQPETWGYIQFSTVLAGARGVTFNNNPDENVIWSLWQVYYLFQLYPYNHRKTQESLQKLKDKNSASKLDFDKIELGDKKDKYIAKAPSPSKKGFWYIRKDGKIWFEGSQN